MSSSSVRERLLFVILLERKGRSSLSSIGPTRAALSKLSHSGKARSNALFMQRRDAKLLARGSRATAVFSVKTQHNVLFLRRTGLALRTLWRPFACRVWPSHWSAHAPRRREGFSGVTIPRVGHWATH